MGMEAAAPPSVGLEAVRLLHEPEPWSSGREGVPSSPPPPCLCPMPSRGQQDRERFVLSGGSDPAEVSVSSGARVPPARGPGLQPPPLAVQVSRLLSACAGAECISEISSLLGKIE